MHGCAYWLNENIASVRMENIREREEKTHIETGKERERGGERTGR